MNAKLLILITSMTCSFAWAAGPDKGPKENREDRPHPEGFFHPGANLEHCEGLKLSDEQKTAFKAERLQFEDKRIDLEAAVKHAHLNLEKVVLNEKSDEKTIRDAAAEVASQHSKMMAAEEDFKADLLIKVLKPNQREEALKCGLLMGPMHHHEGGGEHHPPMKKHDKENK